MAFRILVKLNKERAGRLAHKTTKNTRTITLRAVQHIGLLARLKNNRKTKSCQPLKILLAQTLYSRVDKVGSLAIPP